MVLAQALLVGTQAAVQGYVPASDDLGISIKFDGSNRNHYSEGNSASDPSMIFPLEIAQDTHGSTFATDGRRITLTGADGYQWQSPWLVLGGLYTTDAGRSKSFSSSGAFPIPRWASERLGSGPVSVRIEFALEQLEDLPAQSYPASARGQSVLGFCTEGKYRNGGSNAWLVDCRSAFSQRHNVKVETSTQSGPCDPGSTQPVDSIRNVNFGTLRTLQISPVVQSWWFFSPPTKTAAFCPGTPVAFTQRHLIRRVLVEMPAATIHLKDYMNEEQ
jgi:hypothetical protein